jgi:hypothetical protein
LVNDARGSIVGRVSHDLALAGGCLAAAVALGGCTTVDPGPNFVVPDVMFDANYFYCTVEPQVIFGNGCGDKTSGSCHFTPSAVSGMALQDHPAIACSGGIPTDMTQIGPGSLAGGNLESVTLEMDSDYMNAPFYLRPTQQLPHPLMLFGSGPTDPNVMVIASWAQMQ